MGWTTLNICVDFLYVFLSCNSCELLSDCSWTQHNKIGIRANNWYQSWRFESMALDGSTFGGARIVTEKVGEKKNFNFMMQLVEWQRRRTVELDWRTTFESWWWRDEERRQDWRSATYGDAKQTWWSWWRHEKLKSRWSMWEIDFNLVMDSNMFRFPSWRWSPNWFWFPNICERPIRSVLIVKGLLCE